MKEEGAASKAPYAEAFGQWKNLKLVLLAFFDDVGPGRGLVHDLLLHPDLHGEVPEGRAGTINGVMMTATAISAVFYVVFGWLSDKIGRKPVMLGGMTLALLFYFPGFHLLEKAANPALAEASAKSPVVVTADPKDCSLQFDPVGKTAFVSSCDIIKSALANAGVSYANQKAPAGSVAVMKVGGAEIVCKSAKGLAKPRPRRSRPASRPRSRPPWPRPAIRPRPIRRG
jgi:hypothetical protein